MLYRFEGGKNLFIFIFDKYNNFSSLLEILQ